MRHAVWFVFLLAIGARAEVIVLPPAPSAPRPAEEILVHAPQDPPGFFLRLPSTAENQLAAVSLTQGTPGGWSQPNTWRYALLGTVLPNDPFLRPDRNERRYQQWYLYKINANYFWSAGQGAQNITVAVVDSGIDLNHPDLRDRLVSGVTIVTQSNYSAPSDGQDDNGHGTHIAGLIAAVADNGVGMSGLCWQGRVMPIKVLNDHGEGTDADIASGIRWAVDHGARIINLSLGAPDDGSGPPPALQSAVDYAHAAGVLVVAAAGNTGDDQVVYPAALNHVISVAATDPQDQPASYSTRGPSLDLAAPGGAGGQAFNRDTGILSTFWSASSAISNSASGPEKGEYAITAGTSMAAALVSGAALLLWAQNPGLNPDQVESLLKNSTQDIDVPGADEVSGAGRLDLLRALGNPALEKPMFSGYLYPNPFRPEQAKEVRLVISLPARCALTLEIYNSAREKIYTRKIASETTVPGKNAFAWDGRDQDGKPVANGAYPCLFRTASGARSSLLVAVVLR